MNDSARGVWIRVSIWTFKRFIYTRLGMVIDVRLSTLCGHIVANSISNFTLFIYIISIFCLLCLDVGVIASVFYRMDWEVVYAFMDL
ncbi:tetraspanin-19-like isoform X1 [Malus sylvestris]|uniref:tetraspanin-19-like isoform X1 n=1 Tax=Malus sylvestris TaxID=3752 RepID=UPI0021AD3D9C|nr:tetraspanin-19-like isoform X1 [Malus sylvestris]